HRLLENHADVAAPNFTHLRLRQLHEIAAGEENLAARDPPGRIWDQAQNRQRGDGFARPALADDRHCLALLDGIGHPVDGAHNSRTGPELGVQILDLQEWCQDPSRCSPSGYFFISFRHRYRRPKELSTVRRLTGPSKLRSRTTKQASSFAYNVNTAVIKK